MLALLVAQPTEEAGSDEYLHRICEGTAETREAGIASMASAFAKPLPV